MRCRSVHSIIAEHKAFFYRRDAELASNVIAHVVTAFELGIPIMLIMTDAHRRLVDGGLANADLDPELLKRVQLLRSIDAEQCLEKFSIGGALNETLFQVELGKILDGVPFYAYGELVDVLCQRRRFEDALELEGMWNRLGNRHRFSLLCGYNSRGL